MIQRSPSQPRRGTCDHSLKGRRTPPHSARQYLFAFVIHRWIGPLALPASADPIDQPKTTERPQTRKPPRGCPLRFDQSEIQDSDRQGLPQEHQQAKHFAHWAQPKSISLHRYQWQKAVLAYPNTRNSTCLSGDRSLRPSHEHPTRESGHRPSSDHWANQLQGQPPTPKREPHRRLAEDAHFQQDRDFLQRAHSTKQALHRAQESFDSHCSAKD